MSDHHYLTRRGLLHRTAAGATGALCAIVGPRIALPPPISDRVTLSVSPNPVAADAPFRVQVTGLDPGQLVTLKSQTTDDDGTIWQATASFRADAAGVLDLANQAPITGSYHTADPTGLVWSALPPGTDAHNTSFYIVTVKEPPVTITAETAGRTIARASVSRRLLTSAISVTAIDNQTMSGMLFQPKSVTPMPGMLVFGGSEGGLHPYVLREAALLAMHGFAALALAYFDDNGLPPMLESIPLEYFRQALQWLAARPGVRSDRLGVMGTSRGGELALLLGATFPQLQAVVSYVGSGLVFGAVGDDTKPAWTYHGQPIAHMPQVWAEIPVERINGPVMLIAGEADRVWSSTYYSQVAWNRLRAHQHPYPDEFHHYPNAGHLIRPPYLPTGFSLDGDGGTSEGMARADADSWPRIVRMLQTRLMR